MREILNAEHCYVDPIYLDDCQQMNVLHPCSVLVLTSSPFFNFLCSLYRPGSSLLLLLFRSAAMKILYYNSDKHVKDEESNQK